MSFFICPVCKSVLERDGKSYVCRNCHTFDIAKEGYVNLLPSGKANSAVPGDNKEMVKSRTVFLESGGYKVFADGIADVCREYSLGDEPVIVDAGCGQGYYDKIIKSSLPKSNIVGIDISKFAIKYASNNNKNISYAVAGVYDMPVADECADFVLSIFSPLADREFCRVLKKCGYLVIAVPGPVHLLEMKKILYNNPYENQVTESNYEGFKFVKRIPIQSSLVLENSELIYALFSMTPYFWKTDVEGHERLKNTSYLETRTEFHLLVYQKE
ncbi:MAG: methyltransferase domain-containing protein [Clostridia bacterium]|nr:methyltransferase domain-containing protein [Clostridia bacterium]